MGLASRAPLVCGGALLTMPHEPLGFLLGELCALVEHTGGATQDSGNLSRPLPCIALGLSSNRCSTHGGVPVHIIGIPPLQ